jgi:hypothetical protein
MRGDNKCEPDEQWSEQTTLECRDRLRLLRTSGLVSPAVSATGESLHGKSTPEIINTMPRPRKKFSLLFNRMKPPGVAARFGLHFLYAELSGAPKGCAW